MALRNVTPIRFDCTESVLKIEPKRHGDHRGFFAETYSRSRYSDLGIRHEFVQDNHSLSARVGTLRGLHYQAPPSARFSLLDFVIMASDVTKVLVLVLHAPTLWSVEEMSFNTSVT